MPSHALFHSLSPKKSQPFPGKIAGCQIIYTYILPHEQQKTRIKLLNKYKIMKHTRVVEMTQQIVS